MGFELIPLSRTATTSTVNRLASCLSNWRLVTNNQMILRIISEGYKLQLTTPVARNSKPIYYDMNSELRHHTNQEVQNLIRKKAIVPVEPIPEQFTAGIFSRYKKNHTVENPRIRVVINLKPLNKHVRGIHFRMESLANIRLFLRPDWYIASIDLVDAYFNIGVHPSHQKFLRFFWESQCYQYVCLPFGLKSSPRIFSKIVKVAITFLRRTFNIFLTSYLDDILIMAPTYEECMKSLNTVFLVMSALGFGVSIEKSILTPSVVHKSFLITHSLTQCFFSAR